MKDIYLKSTSLEVLMADLEALFPGFVRIETADGVDTKHLVEAGQSSGGSFALDYCGTLAIPGSGRIDTVTGEVIEPVEFYSGVHCNVRLFGVMETIFDGFSSENTMVLDPKTPCRVFA